MKSLVTLAIPAFDGGRTLPRVLAAVQAQTQPPDEVLVIDDGSTDDTPAIARSAGARVIEHGKNLGLAAARNTCLARAAGEILVFVDADAVPCPDLVQRLTAGYDDPTLGGMGGQVVETEAEGTLADRWRSRFWVQTQGPIRLDRAPFFVGACCSLRRQAAREAGGFSLSFRTNGEDVELSLRLRRRGFRLGYEPRAQVLHLRHDHLWSLLAMIYRHQRDHLRALRLHGEPAIPVVASALRWGPISLLSSLRRHHSLSLAALSPLCHLASLAGCAASLQPR